MIEGRQYCWGSGVWSRREGVTLRPTEGSMSKTEACPERVRGCGGGEVRGESEAEAEQTWWDLAGHCMGFEFYCEACGGFSG